MQPLPFPGPGAYPQRPGIAALGLGIAALVLGAISLSFIWVPLCGMAAFPFAIIGLALGVAGSIVSLAPGRRQPLTMPLIGFILCAVSLIVGVVVFRHTREVAQELAAKSQREFDARI